MDISLFLKYLFSLILKYILIKYIKISIIFLKYSLKLAILN